MVGENLSCGCSGQTKRTLSDLEWFVREKVKVRASLMKQSPKLIRFGFAAENMVMSQLKV